MPGIGIKRVRAEKAGGRGGGGVLSRCLPLHCGVGQPQLAEVERSWWVSLTGPGGQEKESHRVGLSITTPHTVEPSSLSISQPLQ